MGEIPLSVSSRGEYTLYFTEKFSFRTDWTSMYCFDVLRKYSCAHLEVKACTAVFYYRALVSQVDNKLVTLNHDTPAIRTFHNMDGKWKQLDKYK